MAWRMAISEGGVLAGLLTYAEICSACYSGGMRGWRYNEWQYIGSLYVPPSVRRTMMDSVINKDY
jgi:hypothetical protein